jgi:hypothetical protein
MQCEKGDLMADIKQAAKWMQEGERVKRWIWSSDTYLYLEKDWTFHVRPSRDEMSHNYEMGLIDLLAYDWEIAE